MLAEQVLMELNCGGLKDFRRAEEIIKEAGLDTSELAKEIAYQIKTEGWNIDPVAIAYELIKNYSDHPTYFEIYPNYLATQVEADTNELFDYMYENELEWEDLDKYTKFLLQEAGVSPDDWDKYYEERKMYEEA